MIIYFYDHNFFAVNIFYGYYYYFFQFSRLKASFSIFTPKG